MTTDATKAAMEQALQVAVARMQSGGGAPAARSGVDPMSMVMALAPKLLEGGEERDDVAEKLDALKSEELAQLVGHVRVLRKHAVQLARAQQAALEELRMLREHQSATCAAVLRLTEQLERVQLVEAEHDDLSGYPRGPRGAPVSFPSSGVAGDRGRPRPQRPQPK